MSESPVKIGEGATGASAKPQVLEQPSNDEASTSKSNKQSLRSCLRCGGRMKATVDEAVQESDKGLGFFEKYLTIWVALCMVIGSVIGYYAPGLANGLNNATVEQVNIPITVLIWFMILPALIQVDISAILMVKDHPSALLITTGINYAIQPFTMFGWAILFFRYAFAPYIQPVALQNQFIAGAVFLGCGPCTAMVFVWSTLVKGDVAYTLIQVAVNDIILCFLYAPTVGGLIGVANLEPPWATIILATVFFLVIPCILAFIIRRIVIKRWGQQSLKNIAKNATPFTEAMLLLMLVLIFICQGARIPGNITRIFMIAVALLLQGYSIFFLGYLVMYFFRVPFTHAAPGALIGTSNFFELAVALAITIYGPESGAALVTVVGVLTEVPAMLSLVWFCNRTRGWYELRCPPALFPPRITSGRTLAKSDQAPPPSSSEDLKAPARKDDSQPSSDQNGHNDNIRTVVLV